MNLTLRRAFTLVEILIVVGMIVVLVALLVPNLAKAFKYAERTKCAANQKQLVTAILTYAQDNQRVIPPVSSNGDNLSSYYAPRWFIQDDTLTPAPDDVSVWGLGFLWFKDAYPGARVVPTPTDSEGYIREASIFFCPSQTHEDFMKVTYDSSPKSSSFPAPKDTSSEPYNALPVPILGVRLPYFYNPIMNNPDVTANPNPVPLFQQLTDFDTKKDSTPQANRWSGMILLDTIELNPDADEASKNELKYSTIGHADSPKHARGGWNVSYGDNSTLWVPDTRGGGSNTTILTEIDGANADLVLRQNVLRRLSGDDKLLPGG